MRHFTEKVNAILDAEFEPWAIKFDSDYNVIAFKKNTLVPVHYWLGNFRPYMPLEDKDVRPLAEEVKLRMGPTTSVTLKVGIEGKSLIAILKKADNLWWEKREEVGILYCGDEVYPVSRYTIERMSRNQMASIRMTEIPCLRPDGTIDRVLVASIVSKIGPSAKNGVRVGHRRLPLGPRQFQVSGKEGERPINMG